MPTRCSGACCRQFHLQGLTLAGLRERKDRDRDTEVARIFMLLRPDGVQETSGRALFRCTAYAASDGCLQHAARPGMCRRYPETETCPDCGSRSDAEARGVALQVVS